MSVQRLIGIYHTAGDYNVLAGRSWYPRAYDRCDCIAASYALPTRVVVALVAVLSPSSQWEQNLDDASTVIEFHGSIRRGCSSPQEYLDCKVSTYNRNRDKSFSILDEHFDGSEWDDIVDRYVRGPKVNAFYYAIMGKADALVLDSHCFNAWAGRRVVGTRLQNPRIGEWRKAKEAYIRASEIVGETPRNFQAIIWLRHIERIQLGRVPGYERI